MYYDADLQYYFAFETRRYRIGTTWGSIPDSLASLKDILCLKVRPCIVILLANFFLTNFGSDYFQQLQRDITNVLNTVKRTKRTALRTNPKDLFTIKNLPETTSSPKKNTQKRIMYFD